MQGYTKEQIHFANENVQKLIQIVHNLEEIFSGRHFTLDGHLVGSIGEVLASYHYGIGLFDASTPVHDGVSPDGRNVQIKMTQSNSILISDQPDYLIVLYMNSKTGEVQEIYNGPGEIPFTKAYKYKKHNNRYMTVSMLCKEDTKVKSSGRIPAIHDIKKFKKPVQKDVNKMNQQSSVKKSATQTTEEGYINKNNQKNCGLIGLSENHPGQKLYQMKCLNCGYRYEANGCDVWLRKCQKCQV